MKDTSLTKKEIIRILKGELAAAIKKLGPRTQKDVDDYRKTGACEICKRQNPRGLLCRDHRHGTRSLRGLLCTRCNAALGLIYDNPDTCDAMATYLRRGPTPRDIFDPPGGEAV